MNPIDHVLERDVSIYGGTEVTDLFPEGLKLPVGWSVILDAEMDIVACGPNETMVVLAAAINGLGEQGLGRLRPQATVNSEGHNPGTLGACGIRDHSESCNCRDVEPEPRVIRDLEVTHVSINADGSFGIGGRASMPEEDQS